MIDLFGQRRVKVLSIQQPWAWLIASGQKDIENRDWATPYRGLLLIHAGQKMRHVSDDLVKAKLMVPALRAPEHALRFGGIVGIAELVDCVRAHESPWFVGKIGFVLRNARVLPFTPCRGQLGLFDPPAALLAELKLS